MRGRAMRGECGLVGEVAAGIGMVVGGLLGDRSSRGRCCSARWALATGLHGAVLVQQQHVGAGARASCKQPNQVGHTRLWTKE